MSCPKCGQNVVWPASLSPEDKKAIAQQIRRDSVAGMRSLESGFGLDPRESKTIALHICEDFGKCRQCNAAVTDENSICSKCGSVNLNW
jgi:hypothetical protein